MLAAPKVRTPSKLPTALVLMALVSGACYFLFFRGRPEAVPAVKEPAAKKIPPPAPEPREVFEAVLKAPAAQQPPAKEVKVEPRPEPRKIETPPPAPVNFAPPAPPPRTLKNEIDDLCAEGRWRDARLKLSAAFGGPISDAERIELGQKGVRICQEMLQNKPDEREVELYEIQQGDTLEGIAKKFKALSGVKGTLMLLNNYKESALLRAGRKVRIAKGTWSVAVDKSLFKLWILYEGCPFKAYTITTGAPSKETPIAKFVVGNKNPKPAWWPPADMKIKGPVPYGDPQNPLGEWWISLEHDLHHGIGIHGTNDPGSIGSKASNGCVRMLNEEVGEVAAIAFKGMIVTVLE